MVEKEKVRNSLMTKYMLVTMSDEEILRKTKNPQNAENFIYGLINIMEKPYICYLYQFSDTIFKVIMQMLTNEVVPKEEVRQDMYQIVYQLKEYLEHDKEYKIGFREQYEYLERKNLGIDNKQLDITLKELDGLMLPIFDKINSGNISDIKTDRQYLATISYLANHFPLYLRNSFMIMEIKKSLLEIDKDSFTNYKQYSIFKKVARKTLSTIERSYKSKGNNKQKKKIIEEN